MEPELLADINAAKVAFEKHFCDNYKPSMPNIPPEPAQIQHQQASINDSPEKVDFLSHYKRQATTPSSQQSELDEYFCITSCQ
jgi:hypothetical protein